MKLTVLIENHAIDNDLSFDGLWEYGFSVTSMEYVSPSDVRTLK